MARLKPYAGTSHARLTALLNAGNNLSLQENVDFTFGTPTVISGPNGRNTSVVFNPVNYQIYDTQTLRYRRLNLSALAQLGSEEILPVTIQTIPFTTHGILSVINEALGLNLIASEVLDETFNTVQTTYRVRIRDNSSSLAWVASEFYYTANHQLARLMEDGSPRLMEDGTVRTMETV